ncbi:MAG: hypothetical protein M9894_15975 [Planctomycetes bacterium]|nr:hypothetical protein [Planctomycetota bacterium]
MGRWAARVRTAALVVAGLLAAAGSAPAQGPAATVRVTAGGVGGPIVRARPRAFATVRVLLENDAPREVTGVLRAYRGAAAGDSRAEQRLFYERRVTLPRAGRRAETVYYYCQENEPARRLCVLFEPDEGPAPPAVFPELQVHQRDALVLVVSSLESEEALRVFRAALVPGPRRVWRTEAVRADVSALPDHIAGFDPFDAVVVTDLEPGDLPPDRASALIEWVEAGGDLIVAFSGRRALPLELRPLLPVERPGGPDRAVERSLVGLRSLGRGRLPWPGDERVLCDDVVPAPGAEVLAGQPDAPLVVRGRRGAGWVTYLAFPLDAAPLRSWRAVPTFGGALLRPPRAELHTKSDMPMVAPPLEELQLNLSEALATLTPPSALVIAPLLLLYVALVSPLNFSLLSRRRRLHLSQPIAACVVLAFGGAFYTIGRIYKGSEDMVTQVAVVELPTTAGRARVDVMTGYYSTSQALTSAVGPAGAVVGPIAEEPSGREGRIVDDPAGARLEGLTVATWSLRRFRSLRAQDLGAVGLELRLEGTVLRGAVHNRSALTLEGPLLLTPGGFVELSAPLAPGESAEVGKALQRLEPQRTDPLALLQAITHDARAGYPPVYYGRDLGVGLRGDPYGGSARRRILATLVHRLRRVPSSPDRFPVLFVAWANADPGGVVVEGTGAPTLARQLVVVEGQARHPVGEPLTLHWLEPRVLALPPREEDWVPVDGITGAPPTLGAGSLGESAEVTYCWSLPSSEHAPLRLSLLKVRWQVPGWAPHIKSYVDVYDFSRRGWLVATAQTDADREEDHRVWTVPGPKAPAELKPDDLVDPSSGTVLVRFRNEVGELRIGSVGLDVLGVR